MNKEIELTRRKLEREKAAREEAEQLLEKKSLELYNSNVKLKELNNSLETLVEKRTKALRETELEYQTMVESINDMIFRLDMKGNILFTNQIVSKFFGSEQKSFEGESILNFLPKDERKRVYKHFMRLYLKRTCISYFEILTKSPQNTDIWLRLNIQFSSLRCKFCDFKQKALFGINNEVKAEKNCDFTEIIIVAHDISERKKHEIEIEYNLRQQIILSKISLNYNSLDKFEKKTYEALRNIGEHTDVSRVYIFEDGKDGLSTTNTYEWCNEGIEPQIDQLQHVPYSVFPSWKKILKKNGLIYSEDISELPKDVYDILAPQDIKSIVVLPLLTHGKITGFMGFDECRSKRVWKKSEIELLRTVANIISNNFLRHSMQNELIEREKENRIIIDSIPDVIMHVDKSGKIIALKSAQGSNLSNLIKEEGSKTIQTVLGSKLVSLFEDAIQTCLQKGRHQVDFKNLNWDEVEYYEARLVKLNEKEVLIIIRDVTVIKENEKQLEIAKNKAEEIAKMKTEFLANVSHEIRTPLNAILGFSQWLQENTENDLHKGYLSSIINSGRNLLDVLNNILDLSKLEAGTIDIEYNPMNINEIVSDIKLVFETEVNAKGLNLKITVDKSVPAYVLMDELRFYQIIFNLVSNAVKFTDKGFIHVFAFATESDSSNDDEINLVVSVEDTGIGIKEDQYKRIFESFTQQHGESNRNYEGTGLGLTIVDGLLKKLKGTIHIKSEENKGTTFTVTFNNVKIYQTQEINLRAKEENDFIQKIVEPCTIMIVDDIDFNIDVLKALIDSEHVRFIEAKDGTLALAKLGIEKPDLIFMDIRMPGLDGFEVTKMIKSNENLKHIPVIAFSASTLKTKKDLITLMFDDYLQKPVFKKDVEALLRKFLPDHLKYIPKEVVPYKENVVEFSAECMENIDKIIDDLENNLFKKWEKLNGGLVIYEIEAFKNELTELADKYDCIQIAQYSVELGMGLQSFDIDMIEKVMGAFPQLIEKLKGVAENHKNG